MRRARIGSVLIALLAIAALGIAATTLETTLTTDPDDEINPNWDRLPIGQSQAAEIQEEIGDNAGDREEPQDGTADELAETDVSDEAGDSTGLGTGMVPSSTEASPFDQLLTVLRQLLPLVVLLALGAFVYRYREKLLAVFGTESNEEPTSEPAAETEPWPGADPSHIVDRAWLRMVQLTEPPHPETTTPTECATIAREQGLDVEAFEAIATAFERVHYGGVPVAEERPRARSGLRRLGEEDE